VQSTAHDNQAAQPSPVVTASPVSKQRSRLVKRQVVLRAVRATRILSRVRLAEITGLSASSVTHVVRDLIAEGYLAEIGTDVSHGGRPQTLLRYLPTAEFVVAADLRADSVIGHLVDWDGAVHAEVERRLMSGPIDAVIDAVTTLSTDHSDRVRAVALAVPGVTTGIDGHLSLAPDLAELEGVPLAAVLSARLGLPVHVDNDVNLMVVGEHAAGAGIGVDDLVLIHVGETGIGAAILVDGRVRRGAGGRAGEVGFIPLTSAPPEHGVGAFERAWSRRGIIAALDAAGGSPPTDNPLDRLESPDPATRRLRAELLDFWGRAIAACACLVDPGKVLLSGLAAELSDAQLADLSEVVNRYSPTSTPLQRADLGSQAWRIGAIRLAFGAADEHEGPAVHPQTA
jgi:predicted NBD/HSP70 family sugar kinase